MHVYAPYVRTLSATICSGLDRAKARGFAVAEAVTDLLIYIKK